MLRRVGKWAALASPAGVLYAYQTREEWGPEAKVLVRQTFEEFDLEDYFDKLMGVCFPTCGLVCWMFD